MKRHLLLYALLAVALTTAASDSSVIQNNGVQITTAAGWNESLYAEWEHFQGQPFALFFEILRK